MGNQIAGGGLLGIEIQKPEEDPNLSSVMMQDQDAKPKRNELPTVLPERDPPIFEIHEDVLGYHPTNLLYAAKIVRRRTKKCTRLSEATDAGPAEVERTYEYLLHFDGWAKKYDEWTEESKVLKMNEENRRLQNQLQMVKIEAITIDPTIDRQKKMKDIKFLTTRMGIPNNNKLELQQDDRRKKDTINVELERKGPRYVEPEGIFRAKATVNIEIPDCLKQVLFDDWVMVVQNRKLLDLPVKFSVDTILDEYWEACGRIDGSVSDVFCQEMEDHFLKSIYNLMYPPERPQFEFVEKCQSDAEDLGKEGDYIQSFHHVYGFVHLLRLIPTLGDSAALSDMDVDEIEAMKNQVASLLAFLEKKLETYFCIGHYTLSPQDYKNVVTVVKRSMEDLSRDREENMIPIELMSEEMVLKATEPSYEVVQYREINFSDFASMDFLKQTDDEVQNLLEVET